MVKDTTEELNEQLRKRAQGCLKRALGPFARFRTGQWEAIVPLLDGGSSMLVVQRTGWGKSVVYLVASRMLRDAGKGPTLLVSPLLSLMRNQLELAEKFGLVSASLTSVNRDEWDALEQRILANEIDLLTISPERLGNPIFRERILPYLERNLSLLVIDEAHCISDWGHDFRPDYRRILTTVQRLHPNASVLATTATANGRVVEDVARQLGEDIIVQRGPLVRESLKLSVFQFPDQSERLAWLAKYLPKFPGTGIVYTLTVNDAERVAAWLRQNDILARAYHADLAHEERVRLETSFGDNSVKVLVATTALGMGYDKADVGFVVHYQRPGSIVAYYQQIGRAGRSLPTAFVVLLEGEEDDEIVEHFIQAAIPSSECFSEILKAITQNAGSLEQVLSRTNHRRAVVEKAIHILEVENVIRRREGPWELWDPWWKPNEDHIAALASLRRSELQEMRRYVRTQSCRMEFLARLLDDTTVEPCGRCDNCRPHGKAKIDPAKVAEAFRFLREDIQAVIPRKFYPSGIFGPRRQKIEPGLLLERGIALSVYNDAGWGKVVRGAKYGDGLFPDILLKPSVEAIDRLDERPEWIAWVPSLKRPELVESFARRLAERLGVEPVEAIRKTANTCPQKRMQNATTQFGNVRRAFEVIEVRPGRCLLVDDMIDSGWTMTAIGQALLQAGSGPVFPFALATARPRGDS